MAKWSITWESDAGTESTTVDGEKITDALDQFFRQKRGNKRLSIVGIERVCEVKIDSAKKARKENK